MSDAITRADIRRTVRKLRKSSARDEELRTLSLMVAANLVQDGASRYEGPLAFRDAGTLRRMLRETARWLRAAAKAMPESYIVWASERAKERKP